jgi:hypothetical protein
LPFTILLKKRNVPSSTFTVFQGYEGNDNKREYFIITKSPLQIPYTVTLYNNKSQAGATLEQHNSEQKWIYSEWIEQAQKELQKLHIPFKTIEINNRPGFK